MVKFCEAMIILVEESIIPKSVGGVVVGCRYAGILAAHSPVCEHNVFPPIFCHLQFFSPVF